jgi:hypothetical protein
MEIFHFEARLWLPRPMIFSFRFPPYFSAAGISTCLPCQQSLYTTDHSCEKEFPSPHGLNPRFGVNTLRM